MITKYDTGDKVLIPVTIHSALRLRAVGNDEESIYYTIDEFRKMVEQSGGKPEDALIFPEELIEGRAGDAKATPAEVSDTKESVSCVTVGDPKRNQEIRALLHKLTDTFFLKS